ncbi:2-hydroxyacid dehydrogenase [Seminibacterium arietis]|uniref:2-hydroxyacid dehydrogenase n=1 Tax=Seminibacterium arietis TaxID=1173502 RepID=A0ABW3I8W5_9PAST
MKIVFLDSTALPKHIPIPRPNFPHQWIEYEYTSAEQTVERAKEADIIITSKVIFNREVMQQLPNLKLIALTATGTNNIDLIAAKELGITVKNITGYSSVTVPEHVLGLIFALRHNLMNWYRDQLSAKWADCKQFCYFDYPINDVKGSTLGVVGKGSLGTEIGRLATALGMNVMYAERKGAKTIRDGYLPFETVLKEADIVTLHCPLTADTQDLINADTLKLMKPTAYLINTGRGPLVNEQALVEALQNNTIAAAAIDVMVKEPPEKDNLLLQAAKTLPNLIITPHIAWASNQAVDILVKKLCKNIEDFVVEGK